MDKLEEIGFRKNWPFESHYYYMLYKGGIWEYCNICMKIIVDHMRKILS